MNGTACADNSALCNEYLTIWKEVFLKKNNLTSDFFDQHITVKGTVFNDWNEGTSFNVCYVVKTGWALAYWCDHIPVQIKGSSNLLPALPRDTNLTKAQIETTLGEILTTQVGALTGTETLQFASAEQAVDFLIAKANVTNLCNAQVSIDPTTGEWMLECGAELDYAKNKCITAKVSLTSGEYTVSETFCYLTM